MKYGHQNGISSVSALKVSQIRKILAPENETFGKKGETSEYGAQSAFSRSACGRMKKDI